MLNSRFPSVFGDTPDATGLSLDEGETLSVPLGPRRARQQQAGLWGLCLGGMGACPRHSLYLLGCLPFLARETPGWASSALLQGSDGGIAHGLGVALCWFTNLPGSPQQLLGAAILVGAAIKNWERSEMSRETILTIPKIMCHLSLALLPFLFRMDRVFVLLASNFGVFGLAPLGREWGSTCGYTQGVECLPAPHCGLREYLAFGESSCYWGWVDTLLLWGGEGGVNIVRKRF